MQIQANPNLNSKDTAADSNAPHPAATPACQRLTGRWPSVRLQ